MANPDTRPVRAGKAALMADQKTPPGALRRALAYLRSYLGESAGAFFSLLLVSGANLATPVLIGRAIDDGIGPRRLGVIFLIVGALVGLALARGLFTFLQGYLAERASQGVAYDLRDALFERIERLSFSYYDRVQTGQLVTRLTSDVEQIRAFAGSGVVQLANAVVMIVGTTVLLLYLDWQLALVALAIVPVIVLLLLRFIGRIRPLFREVQQTLGRLNTVLQEDLSGVRVIRAFAREDYETARYRSVNDELLEKNLTTVRVFSNNFPFVFLFANLGTLAIIWFGGWQVI
ncbi:MAG TPA: ABC transporter ATP-binding protein, partial [Rubrobacter sp.]|nr:ABC transporter ATP-binding protein [Rubrobacter sp.]